MPVVVEGWKRSAEQAEARVAESADLVRYLAGINDDPVRVMFWGKLDVCEEIASRARAALGQKEGE